jgi:hypothetical protein
MTNNSVVLDNATILATWDGGLIMVEFVNGYWRVWELSGLMIYAS